MSRSARIVALVLALVGGGGCKQPKQPKPPAGASLEVTLAPSERSNGGRPVYVVIRRIDQKTFDAEQYGDITPLVTELDETVIGIVLAFPCKTVRRSFAVEKLPEQIGVYGLFTAPDDERWRLTIAGPSPRLRFELDVGSIVEARKQGGRRRDRCPGGGG